ncbi:kinesin-like protein KIFC3 isoform X2 [Dromiciops gliroides]|uniref:kinesin-like protein KIFC3 isoform X2 n=1 Tax=Dromiciops gliroides TaxID=33562 RepID=UPI001CC5814F|nr:kinesin-like protein KIFC3 isoform X2 [Dromiciops gliroides]
MRVRACRHVCPCYPGPAPGAGRGARGGLVQGAPQLPLPLFSPASGCLPASSTEECLQVLRAGYHGNQQPFELIISCGKCKAVGRGGGGQIRQCDIPASYRAAWRARGCRSRRWPGAPPPEAGELPPRRDPGLGSGDRVPRSLWTIEPRAMITSLKTWNPGTAPSTRALWKGSCAQDSGDPVMASPASPCSRPFPHASQGRWRTGLRKDTLGGGEEDSGQTSTHPTPAQRRALSVDWSGPGSPRGLYLTVQVENLKEKLIGQAQEVNRLRSELGGTDLEKHRDLLMVENERLRQDMKRCEAELQELRARPPPCPDCEHSKESAQLREKLAQLQVEAEENKGRLAELDLEVQQKTNRLAEVELRLKDSLAEKAEEEERLSRRLRDSQETIATLKAQPQPVKYIIKTVEVDSSKTKQALCETQARNQYLQEQVGMQRQVLKEMEQQLQNSQQTTTQLKAQIMMYESELERAHGQMLEEMQTMEEEKNRAIEEAFARAQVEMKAVHENLAGVRTNLLTLQPALRTLTNDYNGLKRQVRDFPLLLQEALRSARAEIGQAIEEVNSTNRELLRKYRRELQLRKKCHNELVRLKGNIRVIGRVRPITKEDGDGPDAANAVTFDSDDDAVIHLLHKGKPVSFELDKVFPPHATQQDVFQEVQALITSCIDGYNVCIFAYGQTGAGKTYTMEGTVENPGINQRALQLLFNEVQEKAADWEYTITVSVAEIYNEALRDLLGKEPQEKLEIKLCPDGSGQLYVPGLTEFKVQSVEDINRVFEFGHTNRTTEYTNLNEHSSRSHALLIITVRGTDYSTGLRTTGKLNLVDLAGSERVGKSGAEGSRLREAQYINKSLSALGDVISALRSRQGHVPFRNSKLTYLLQDSLSGDSKTLMLVQVSPVEKNTSETLCSLKFAERVRSVELGPGSRRTELMSWSSQEHLEFEGGPVQTPSSARSFSSSSSGPPMSRSSSIRRKLQTSGKTKPVAV